MKRGGDNYDNSGSKSNNNMVANTNSGQITKPMFKLKLVSANKQQQNGKNSNGQTISGSVSARVHESSKQQRPVPVPQNFQHAPSRTRNQPTDIIYSSVDGAHNNNIRQTTNVTSHSYFNQEKGGVRQPVPNRTVFNNDNQQKRNLEQKKYSGPLMSQNNAVVNSVSYAEQQSSQISMQAGRNQISQTSNRFKNQVKNNHHHQRNDNQQNQFFGSIVSQQKISQNLSRGNSHMGIRKMIVSGRKAKVTGQSNRLQSQIEVNEESQQRARSTQRNIVINDGLQSQKQQKAPGLPQGFSGSKLQPHRQLTLSQQQTNQAQGIAASRGGGHQQHLLTSRTANSINQQHAIININQYHQANQQNQAAQKGQIEWSTNQQFFNLNRLKPARSQKNMKLHGGPMVHHTGNNFVTPTAIASGIGINGINGINAANASKGRHRSVTRGGGPEGASQTNGTTTGKQWTNSNGFILYQNPSAAPQRKTYGSFGVINLEQVNKGVANQNNDVIIFSNRQSERNNNQAQNSIPSLQTSQMQTSQMQTSQMSSRQQAQLNQDLVHFQNYQQNSNNPHYTLGQDGRDDEGYQIVRPAAGSEIASDGNQNYLLQPSVSNHIPGPRSGSTGRFRQQNSSKQMFQTYSSSGHKKKATGTGMVLASSRDNNQVERPVDSRIQITSTKGKKLVFPSSAIGHVLPQQQQVSNDKDESRASSNHQVQHVKKVKRSIIGSSSETTIVVGQLNDMRSRQRAAGQKMIKSKSNVVVAQSIQQNQNNQNQNRIRQRQVARGQSKSSRNVQIDNKRSSVGLSQVSSNQEFSNQFKRGDQRVSAQFQLQQIARQEGFSTINVNPSTNEQEKKAILTYHDTQDDTSVQIPQQINQKLIYSQKVAGSSRAPAPAVTTSAGGQHHPTHSKFTSSIHLSERIYNEQGSALNTAGNMSIRSETQGRSGGAYPVQPQQHYAHQARRFIVGSKKKQQFNISTTSSMSKKNTIQHQQHQSYAGSSDRDGGSHLANDWAHGQLSGRNKREQMSIKKIGSVGQQSVQEHQQIQMILEMRKDSDPVVQANMQAKRFRNLSQKQHHSTYSQRQHQIQSIGSKPQNKQEISWKANSRRQSKQETKEIKSMKSKNLQQNQDEQASKQQLIDKDQEKIVIPAHFQTQQNSTPERTSQMVTPQIFSSGSAGYPRNGDTYSDEKQSNNVYIDVENQNQNLSQDSSEMHVEKRKKEKLQLKLTPSISIHGSLETLKSRTNNNSIQGSVADTARSIYSNQIVTKSKNSAANVLLVNNINNSNMKSNQIQDEQQRVYITQDTEVDGTPNQDAQDTMLRDFASPEGKPGFLKRMQQQQQSNQDNNYFTTGDSFNPSHQLNTHRPSYQHPPTTESSAQYYTNGLGAHALNLNSKAAIYTLSSLAAQTSQNNSHRSSQNSIINYNQSCTGGSKGIGEGVNGAGTGRYFDNLQTDQTPVERENNQAQQEQEVFLIKPGSDGIGIASFGVVSSSHHNYYNNNQQNSAGSGIDDRDSQQAVHHIYMDNDHLGYKKNNIERSGSDDKRIHLTQDQQNTFSNNIFNEQPEQTSVSPQSLSHAPTKKLKEFEMELIRKSREQSPIVATEVYQINQQHQIPNKFEQMGIISRRTKQLVHPKSNEIRQEYDQIVDGSENNHGIQSANTNAQRDSTVCDPFSERQSFGESPIRTVPKEKQNFAVQSIISSQFSPNNIYISPFDHERNKEIRMKKRANGIAMANQIQPIVQKTRPTILDLHKHKDASPDRQNLVHQKHGSQGTSSNDASPIHGQHQIRQQSNFSKQFQTIQSTSKKANTYITEDNMHRSQHEILQSIANLSEILPADNESGNGGLGAGLITFQQYQTISNQDQNASVAGQNRQIEMHRSQQRLGRKLSHLPVDASEKSMASLDLPLNNASTTLHNQSNFVKQSEQTGKQLKDLFRSLDSL